MPIKPNGEIVPSLKCSTCPISSGCSWKCLRGDDLCEIAELRVGLNAAIRAANLALFVISKQGVMPNSSWQAGFEKDMAIATGASAHGQSAKEGS